MSEKRAQQALIEQLRLLSDSRLTPRLATEQALARVLQVLDGLSAGGPRSAPLPQWGRLALPGADSPGADSRLGHPEATTLATLTEPLPGIVAFAGRSVKSSELLGRLSVELCAAALGEDPGLVHKPALTQAVRFVVALLAATYVGRSIEVRVPPAAACQCDLPGPPAAPGEAERDGTVPGSGPVHTRGTPPNVVETDPPTFLRLAVGSLSWQQARADYAVRASGSRADLSALLPIVDAG